MADEHIQRVFWGRAKEATFGIIFERLVGYAAACNVVESSFFQNILEEMKLLMMNNLT